MFKKGFLFINSSKYNTMIILFVLNKKNFNGFNKDKKFFYPLFLETSMSCGQFGFRGNRKHTPFAKITLIENISKKILAKNIIIRFIIFKGFCFFKSIILTYLYKALLNNIYCSDIIDITSFPHNGCRLPNRKHK